MRWPSSVRRRRPPRLGHAARRHLRDDDVAVRVDDQRAAVPFEAVPFEAPPLGALPCAAGSPAGLRVRGGYLRGGRVRRGHVRVLGRSGRVCGRVGHRPAQVQGADLRMMQHLATRAGQPDPAVLQHHPVGGQPEPGPRVLLDQQDGLALLVHQPDRVEDRLQHQGRQAHGRLVQDDQARVEHQAPGELHQALLAAGQAAGLLAQPLRDLREHLQDASQPAVGQPALAQDVAAEHDVLAHRHLTEQAVVLRDQHHAHVQHLPGALPGQALTAQADLAEPRVQQPADRARAGWTCPPRSAPPRR